jgi:hypothetical protein
MMQLVTASEMISSTAAVLLSELLEKLHSQRCPILPDELPSFACDGSLERGLVAGLCRVNAICSPLPDHAVWFSRKDGALDSFPDEQVLANLLKSEHVLNVSSPSIGMESFCHGSHLASTFGDACKQMWRDLADGLSVDPVVSSEQC